MIGLVFSIFCFVASIYEGINAHDIASIILMSASIIWYVLYLVAINMSNRNGLMRNLLEKKGGIKE